MSPTIAGYSDLEPLDRGGFSTVYVATRDDLGQRVAVKVLQIELTDHDAVRRFQRECTNTGRLTNHPNAVTALDAGVTGEGHPYLATPYYPEGSLARQLQERGPLPVERVLVIGVLVAGALATAHQEGIRHHDVKPENILVTEFGDPVLADFGISRLATAPEYTSTVHFTPNHVAPEVLDYGEITDAVDVYSLASTLFHLVEGRPPYVARSPSGGPDIGRLRTLKLAASPPYSERTPPDVREALDAALAPRPADRPTITEFADSLRACQRRRNLEPTRMAVISRWARPTDASPPLPPPPAPPPSVPPAPGPGPAAAPVAPGDDHHTLSGTLAASTIGPADRSPGGSVPPRTPAPPGSSAEGPPPTPPTAPVPPPAELAATPAVTGAEPGGERRGGRVLLAVAGALLLAGVVLGALRVGGGAGGATGSSAATTAVSVSEDAADATGDLPPVPDPPVGLAACPPPPEAQVDVAEAAFDPADPPLPTDLAVEVLSEDRLRVAWNDASDGEVTHLLALRCSDDDGGEVQIRFYGAGLPERLDIAGIDTSVTPCVAVGIVARFAEGIGQLWPGDPWVCADTP